MPPVPNTVPGRSVPEIPPDKDAPERNGPTQGEELMFQHRSTEFDPRISAIASHLRAIEKELGGIGRSASRRASAFVASRKGYQVLAAFGSGRLAVYRL